MITCVYQIMITCTACLSDHAKDAREKTLLQMFLEEQFPRNVQMCLAKLLFQLSKDSPLSAFLQWKKLDHLRSILDVIERQEDTYLAQALEDLRFYSRLFADVMQTCVDSGNNDVLEVVCNFFHCLLSQVEQIHAKDVPVPDVQEIPNTYKPETGVSYWFTRSGCQVRKAPVFLEHKPNQDVLDAQCSKIYPRVSRGGFSYMFTWLCPRHGHCYGYHLIPNQEGKKDPFYSLYKYCAKLPECVVYDASCQLHEYILNRMPSFAREIRFCDDKFHSYGHRACATCYRAQECGYLAHTNTSRAEQFNSFLNCVKYTASHLSKLHFSVFVQYFIHRWNMKKTESFAQAEKFADMCCK